MRILELGKFYPPERGGIETLLRSWCEGFAARGARVDCVVANRSARTARELVNGVHIHRLASFGMALSTSIAPGYPGAPRRFRPDIVHAQFPNPLADLAVVLTPRRSRVVVSWHSDIVRQAALLRAYLPLQRAMLRRADRIVVATPNHIEFSPWLPEFRSKCEVIPFGLNLDRFAISPQILSAVADLRSAASGKPILLNVGRFVGYKGQRFAIEALRDLDAILWLVGTGPLQPELEAIAKSCGVAQKVRFWGDVPDERLPLFFHACDVFVFPSITPNEAFGLVQVEAMACGKPVVACQLKSGVPYVCAHRSTGLTVPPGDSGALAGAIRELLSNRDLSTALGQAGRRRAHEEFSEPVMVQRYWKLFESLLPPDTTG